MTTDEIVKALRENAEWCGANEYEIPLCMGDNQLEAAGLIESLQAENERLAIHGGRYMQLADERYKMFERAIKRADDAEAQLAKSRRRERAAVEFIKYLDRNYSGYMAEDERFADWRGHQEAGEGGQNE